MRIYGWGSIMLCQHPDKSGDHKHRDSENMFLICHVPHVTTCLKVYVNLWVEAFYSKPPPCHIW